MTPLIFLLASLAGGIGAALRYLVDIGIMTLTKGRFPWGIVVVNITGSFALGVVAASLPDVAFIVGAGLLGGYTTFSTAMLDALALWKDGERPAWVLHLLGTFAVCVLAALGGIAIGSL
ncbi:chromosome condensation protein CrcB [Microbacterium sp. CH12i]|uniref:fluoride efflux transporter FluC n=1 Tax=Microbacterium sp. CH12i TaxID=1479651 RepID=UPI0004612003|nr:CrcB family protein [Microbacterium sp. CH12i]KDA04653.1 chromosome condensation protein CrcB [Microbacterium sp. CH12i]